MKREFMYLIKSVFEANIHKFIRFMISGLPSFLLAIPLNIFLVKVLALPYLVAYILVMLMQITINFFFLKRFTFHEAKELSVKRRFTLFMLGIILFRAIDALVYSALIKYLGLYYVLAQILNVGVFSLAKYLFSKHIFEGISQ